jgi:2-oxoglutarate ferredoxin oxidoreductase subunit alpha
VVFLPVPLAGLVNDRFPDPRQRILLKNIAYAGALVALLDIDVAIVKDLLAETFAGKAALLESNREALNLGFDYAKEVFDCPLPFHLETMNENEEKILIDGNTATALGCLYAGATVAAWYPITPSTSVMDAFTQFCAKYRKDPETGRNNYLIVQAEDELAAIGMVIGACWNGARSFTATSGPGISLMNELLGLAYYSEIPAVVIDVQRVGPSTGMPTRTQQADLLSCAYASHGDTKHLLLFPANPAECFEFAVNSFDLAERFQTPVLMLSDLDIGMNDWVVPRLKWDDSYRPDRGRVLTEEDLKRVPQFRRYTDEDQYYVPARTLPGIAAKGAYVTRGSGHNKYGGYTETPSEYQEVVDRLALKHHAAADFIPLPKTYGRSKSHIGLIAIGGCDPAVREAVDVLAAQGIPTDYLRICGFPFHRSVEQFLFDHEVTFIVEQNRDAQLRSLITLETSIPKNRLGSILVYGGFPLSVRNVVDEVVSHVEVGHAVNR